tara:strand:- start:231 stop:386 length:156 start_codon:yes stop_codon:yes gene_type:complete
MTFFLFASFFILGFLAMRGKTTALMPVFIGLLVICVFLLHHHADDVLNLSW